MFTLNQVLNQFDELKRHKYKFHLLQPDRPAGSGRSCGQLHAQLHAHRQTGAKRQAPDRRFRVLSAGRRHRRPSPGVFAIWPALSGIRPEPADIHHGADEEHVHPANPQRPVQLQRGKRQYLPAPEHLLPLSALLRLRTAVRRRAFRSRKTAQRHRRQRLHRLFLPDGEPRIRAGHRQLRRSPASGGNWRGNSAPVGQRRRSFPCHSGDRPFLRSVAACSRLLYRGAHRHGLPAGVRPAHRHPVRSDGIVPV